MKSASCRHAVAIDPGRQPPRVARVARPGMWVGIALLSLLSLSVALGQETIGELLSFQYKTVDKVPESMGDSFVKMPLSEWKDLVLSARQADPKNKVIPSLVRSSYMAELSGASLVGSGTWVVNNPGVRPVVLPITSLNLALSKARNTADNTDAVLGDLEGNFGLLVSKPGLNNITFEWSARGATVAGGFQFKLALPPCPLTSVTIELPDDHGAVGARRAAALLSGPHETNQSMRKRAWKLSLTRQGATRSGHSAARRDLGLALFPARPGGIPAGDHSRQGQGRFQVRHECAASSGAGTDLRLRSVVAALRGVAPR